MKRYSTRKLYDGLFAYCCNFGEFFLSPHFLFWDDECKFVEFIAEHTGYEYTNFLYPAIVRAKNLLITNGWLFSRKSMNQRIYLGEPSHVVRYSFPSSTLKEYREAKAEGKLNEFLARIPLSS